METLEVATRLYNTGPSWVIFFREILGPGGLVSKTYPDQAERLKFEQSDEYLKLLQMFERLYEQNPSSKNEKTKEITIRVPLDFHGFLVRQSEEEGFATLNKFAIRKLMKGCFDPFVSKRCPNQSEDWVNCEKACGHKDCPRNTQGRSQNNEQQNPAPLSRVFTSSFDTSGNSLGSV